MTRNVAASVRQRLLNYARAGGRPFNEVLQYFALERFLYCLGRSPTAWDAHPIAASLCSRGR